MYSMYMCVHTYLFVHIYIYVTYVCFLAYIYTYITQMTSITKHPCTHAVHMKIRQSINIYISIRTCYESGRMPRSTTTSNTLLPGILGGRRIIRGGQVAYPIADHNLVEPPGRGVPKSAAPAGLDSDADSGAMLGYVPT